MWLVRFRKGTADEETQPADARSCAERLNIVIESGAASRVFLRAVCLRSIHSGGVDDHAWHSDAARAEHRNRAMARRSLLAVEASRGQGDLFDL